MPDEIGGHGPPYVGSHSVFDQSQKERSRHGSTIIRTGTDVVYGGYCFLNMSHSGSQGFKGKIPAGYALLRRAEVTTVGPTLPQARRAFSICPSWDTSRIAAMLAIAQACAFRLPIFS